MFPPASSLAPKVRLFDDDPIPLVSALEGTDSISCLLLAASPLCVSSAPPTCSGCPPSESAGASCGFCKSCRYSVCPTKSAMGNEQPGVRLRDNVHPGWSGWKWAEQKTQSRTVLYRFATLAEGKEAVAGEENVDDDGGDDDGGDADEDDGGDASAVGDASEEDGDFAVAASLSPTPRPVVPPGVPVTPVTPVTPVGNLTGGPCSRHSALLHMIARLEIRPGRFGSENSCSHNAHRPIRQRTRRRLGLVLPPLLPPPF